MRRFERFYRTKSTTSIYFLLWAIFTALSLAIVFVGALSQRLILTQTYKDQSYREVTEKGKQIERDILSGSPEWTGGNFSGYVRLLSQIHNVELYLLSADGEVLFPREPNFSPDAPEVEEQYDFSEEIQVLLPNLEAAKNLTETTNLKTGMVVISAKWVLTST